MKIIKNKIVKLDRDNVDTDQIIPAKYLTVTDKSGLGKHLFSYWRYYENGTLNKDFPLNEFPESTILIAGKNFGCGSSREHAPWAIKDFGIQAIICESAADIFKNNAFKNNIPVIEIGEAAGQLKKFENGDEIIIDFEMEEIRSGDIEIRFFLNPFQKYCIINNINEFDFLLKQEDKISLYEEENKK